MFYTLYFYYIFIFQLALSWQYFGYVIPLITLILVLSTLSLLSIPLFVPNIIFSSQ